MTNPFNPDLPFFYPTSVMLLDDDVDFLSSYRGLLCSDFATIAYSEVSPTLNYIRAAHSLSEPSFQMFSGYSPFAEGEDSESGDKLVILKTSTMQKIAQTAKRYGVPSVLIVDEMMPEMRGLEVCHLLQETGIKTILLSGKVTSDAVVTAFNGRKMDRFISKADPQAFEKLHIAINELQHEFMLDKQHPISSALHASRCHNFTNDQLSSFFDHVYERFPFIEYFYHSRSGGFLLRNAQGSTRICLLSDHLTLFETADHIADSIGANSASYALKEGKLVPWHLFDDFGPETDWEEVIHKLLFPAEHHEGVYWALISEDSIPYPQNSPKTSWDAYRKQLINCPINSPAVECVS